MKAAAPKARDSAVGMAGSKGRAPPEPRLATTADSNASVQRLVQLQLKAASNPGARSLLALAEKAQAFKTPLQRVIASDATVGTYTFAGGARFESTANTGEKTGRKPLLVVPTTTANTSLHVHLIPDQPITRMTGWNIKQAPDTHRVIDNTTQAIDAEDQQLFTTHANGWRNKSSYPTDIQWSNESKASREQRGLEMQAERLGENRAKFVEILKAKRDRFVETTVAQLDPPAKVDLIMQFTTTAKKNTQLVKVSINKNIKPHEAEGVSTNLVAQSNGAARYTVTFATRDVFAAEAASVRAGLRTSGNMQFTWDFVSEQQRDDPRIARIETFADTHIKKAEAGDLDEDIGKWHGVKGDVKFPGYAE